MPFLRATTSDAVHELRSSRSLVGTSPSKCDVVVRHAGVRELHALLNLAPNRASATLVPFSAADADGACYVNGRAVPLAGTILVHGDKIAFGAADAAPASFTFELTPRSATPGPLTRQRRPTARISSAASSTASFRRALDALRGDPLGSDSPSRSSNAAVRAPASRVTNAAISNGATSENEQLGKFLLEASTDSLLSEFVERKLRQSAQPKRALAPTTMELLPPQPKRAFVPMAMEPPPSLSASDASSAQSSAALDDSILNRSAASHFANSRGSAGSHAFRRRHGDSTEMYVADDMNALALSTAERNAVEMERLGLSQQLREVNSVLNGETAFRSSYMAFESSTRPATIQQHRGRDGRHDASDDDDAVDEDDDDELPAMVEKKPMPRVPLATGSSDSVPTPAVRTTAVAAPPPTALERLDSLNDARDDDDDEFADSNLDESLPRFSEPVRASQRLAPALAQVTQSIRASADSTALTVMQPRTRPRTALHQQLIDQMLRMKRRELRAQTFVRWRRGLRVQAQNRQQRAQQLRVLDARLVRLRRDRMFRAWCTVAGVASQVLACRVDAFQARSARRVLASVWLQWRLLHAAQHTRQRRRRLLAAAVHHLASRTKQQALHAWTLCTREHRHCEQLARQETELLGKSDARVMQLARRHHRHRTLRRLLGRWRALAAQQTRRLRVLAVLVRRGSSLQMQRAWRKWSLEAALARNAQTEQQVQRARAETLLAGQHAQQQNDLDVLRATHAAELARLRAQLTNTSTQLQALQQQQTEARDATAQQMQQQQRDSEQRRLHASHEWSQRVERFLEGVVQRCDRHVAQASDDLEQILALAEHDALGARFVAARVLVDVVLEQKVHNSSELVAAHDALLARLQQCALSPIGPTAAAAKQQQQLKPTDTAALSANATFLHDMARQRVTRLHQLLSAVAKLAATTIDAHGVQRLDAAKLRHGAFLTDAIRSRELRHVEAMTAALWSLCTATAERTPLPAATA